MTNFGIEVLLKVITALNVCIGRADIDEWTNFCTQQKHLKSSWSVRFTVHEQYAFLPSDLHNYAFRAGRHAFHRGKNDRICKHAAMFGESTDIYTNL